VNASCYKRNQLCSLANQLLLLYLLLLLLLLL
jgi:hypothetical protein